MIAASVSGGAVCLRCRLRLLQSIQPLQSSNRSRIPKVRQPNIRYFTSESTTRFDADPISEGGQDEPRGDHDEAQQGMSLGGKKYESKGMNGPKKLLSGGRVLTEGVEDLGSRILGKPAYAIVMRDHGRFQKKHRPTFEDLDDEPTSQSTIDIEALLDNQRRVPTVKEVRENIDGLRPTTDTTLPEREFRRLQSLLTDGFLSVQLMAYLEYNKRHGFPHSSPHGVLHAKQPAKGVDKPFKYDWIKHISPWVPLGDQQSIADGTDPNLHLYVTDEATAKAKLAVRIMRECWGLSIAELSAGLGETRVKVRNSEFLLLMRGTRRWANTMGKIQLDPDEKIEAFRNQKTLRLVTTKTKASVLIRSLHETLKQITTISFPIQMVTSEPIDEAVLEELGRITNTHIRISTTYNRLHVTWIEAETGSAKGLEDTRETVVRLLLTALKPELVTSSLSVAGVKYKQDGRFIADTTSKEKLGWKDRMSQWGRYILPLEPEKNTSGMVSPLQKFPLPVEPQSGLLSGEGSDFDENKEFLPETPFPVHPVKWAEDVKTATKAHFGYLLHENDPKASIPPLPRLLTANHPRVFAPVAPHPVRLALFETSDKSALVQQETTVVIHFWPSPPSSNPSSNGKPEPPRKRNRKGHAPDKHVSTPPAPILELHLAVLGGEVTGVKSLRAIKRTHFTDVMFPASPTDLRLTQTQYTLLEGAPAKLTTWQPIADFLKPAHLDLANGKLRVPPHQRFPIPMRLFSDPLVSVVPDPDGLVGTLYTFVGFEVHRSVSIPYEGCKLTYTSVDAGQAGRRGAEVSLEPAFGEDGSYMDADGVNFWAACQKLAETDASWLNYVSNRKS
ncbi:mitochondrial inner-membrane-bound regulator-domain-containing protein [Hypoxylon cercidicola]|nr:mitochondrial inner-membrane-bound regulator-domain-containing protein [Hypoxylon cercidicola]